MIRFTADAETVREGNFFPKLKISLISRLRIPKNFVRILGIGFCGKAKRNANKVKNLTSNPNTVVDQEKSVWKS